MVNISLWITEMNENAILPGFYGRFLLVYAMTTLGQISFMYTPS